MSAMNLFKDKNNRFLDLLNDDNEAEAENNEPVEMIEENHERNM